MNRFLSVLVLPALFVSVFAFSPERAGFAPAGTPIPELSTPTARHYSNGDGSIRAVISTRPDPGPEGDLDALVPITDPPYSGCVWELFGMTYGRIPTGMLCGRVDATYQYRAYAEWSTASIPDGSSINSVRCSTFSKVYQTYPSPSAVLLWSIDNGRVVPQTDQQLFLDCGAGTQYATYPAPNPNPTRWLAASLGSQACAHVQNQLGADLFAVGYDHQGSGPNWVIEFEKNAEGFRPYLIVDYSASGAPPQPTPELPANAGPVPTLRPTLQVAAIANATQYEFRVYAGATLLRTSTSAVRSWTLDVDLTQGATYTWDCRAENSVGWGPYFGPRWSFTVQVLPPPAPTLVSPPNGAYVNTLTPTLAIAAVPGAAEYHFMVFQPGGGVPIAEGYVTPPTVSWVVTGGVLANGQPYEWTCEARNVGGWGPFATRWTINVLLPPATPVPSSPANAGYVQVLRPMLAVNPVVGATSYDFRVYNQAGSTLIRSGSSPSPWWTLDIDLTNNATYQWDCRANNQGGPGSWFTPRWTFTVLLLPVAPVPILPINGATVATLTPTLTVGAVPTATRYHFRVYDQTGSVVVVQDNNVLTNSWTVPGGFLNDGVTYAWDCAAYNASGWGLFFSPRWTFTTVAIPPPPVPNLPTPDSSVVSTLAPALRVNAIMGCNHYSFRVFNEAGNPVNTGTSVTNLITVPLGWLAEGSFYRWECAASNNGGSTYGQYFAPRWRFAVIFAPVQTQPPAGGVVTILRPTLEVQAKSYAVQYEFRVFQGLTLIRTGVSGTNAWTLDIDLVSGTTYNWDCRVATSKGWGPRCAVRFFSVWLLPVAPAAVSPPDGGTVATLTPPLQVVAVPGATRYHFRVYNSSNVLVGEDNNAPANSWGVPNGWLAFGETYAWDCAVMNPAGWGPFFAPRWSFAVSQLPPAPVHVSPPDGGRVYTLTPELRVEEAVGCTEYHFQVREGGTLVREVYVPDYFWTVTPALEDGHTYQWQCQASNGFWGPFSGPWSLIVDIPDEWPEGWQEVTKVPSAPTPKELKDGAWLTVATPPGASYPFVYAAKGNKTGDFFRCDPWASDSGTWYQLESIPADEGGRAKLPKKGCAAISDGERFIYMTKGNNTLGFWRYDVEADSWGRLPDVPLGGGKKVKGGNDLAYVVKNDTGWVYLLKGQQTEFYRYNTESRQWDTLDEALYGAAPKYGMGSFLVYDQGTYLYAHQAKFTDAARLNHYMFRYDIQTDSWKPTTQAIGMPVQGKDGGRIKLKKSKDGGSGVWQDGSMYALKGGNTCQLFRYRPAGDSWTELDTMRSVGSTGKKKKVKSGGDLAGYGGGTLFAFKGNKTYEFWRYVEPALAGSRTTSCTPHGAMAEPSPTFELRFAMSPNPMAGGFATINYHLPKAGPMTVTAFDVAGRVVFRGSAIAARQSSMTLDLRRLSAGVYLVQLEAAGRSASRKLVIRR